ncbi:hypothetical protein NKJ10_19470 [Mesorhizobium sp. M0204]|uniref:hypothetical protein n=1 Tax=Mesorhizobium sp. M0204 TaxID=2956913 RepID=UPI003334BD1E
MQDRHETDKSKVRSQPVVVELPLLPELAAELSCAPAGNGSSEPMVGPEGIQKAIKINW